MRICRGRIGLAVTSGEREVMMAPHANLFNAGG